MGLFERLSNLLSGIFSLKLKILESKNPAAVYEQSINKMREKYTRLMTSSASVAKQRNLLNAKLEKEKFELIECEKLLNAAVNSGQDDVALLLIEKKEQLERSIPELEKNLEKSKEDVEKAKEALNNLKAEIEKLKVERDQAIVQLRSAETRLELNSLMDGTSIDAELRALDDLREHIKDKVAQADLSAEMNDADLDNRLKKLKSKSGSVVAKNKLEQIKKELAEKAAKELENKKALEEVVLETRKRGVM